MRVRQRQVSLDLGDGYTLNLGIELALPEPPPPDPPEQARVLVSATGDLADGVPVAGYDFVEDTDYVIFLDPNDPNTPSSGTVSFYLDDVLIRADDAPVYAMAGTVYQFADPGTFTLRVEHDTGFFASTSHEITVDALVVPPPPVDGPVLTFDNQGRALIDGQLTYPNSAAEGLLMNVRLVQATSDFSAWLNQWDAEANTDAFIAMLPTWKSKGMNSFTINCQGGNFGPSPTLTGNSFDQGMWNSDGSVRTAHRDRLVRVIEAALALDMIPMVGLFYFRTDQVLANEAAVLAAVENAKTILEPYKSSIIIEVSNEAENGNWDHTILQQDRTHEIVDDLVANGFFASASHHSGVVPTVAQQGDGQIVMLHANGETESEMVSMINAAKSRFPNLHIMINEDGGTDRTANEMVSRIGASVNAGCSWGYHEPLGYQYWSGDLNQQTMDWAIDSAVQIAVFDEMEVLTNPSTPPPPPPSSWGAFPTILNPGWANWNLDGVPFDSQVPYVQPPALPSLPSVPANAISVTPSTIQNAVSNNPSGSTFVLQPGTYNMTLPTKGGNRYFGDPNNWNAVIFHGQDTRQLAVQRGNDNVEIYYMTFQRFLGYNASGSWNASGAIDPAGNNWRLCGVVLRWNHYAGMFASGSGEAHYIIAYQNGQYGFTGAGSNWTFDCIEVYENGEQQYLPSGITEYSTSDRGACKFGQMYDLNGNNGGPLVCRRWHSYRNAYHGIWFDIRIEDIIVEYCWFEDQRRAGIDFEAGRPDGRPIIARFNLLDQCGYQTVSGTWWSNYFAYYPAAIQAQICDNTEVYANKVINGPRGIGGLHDESHPQYDGSASTPGAGTVNASPCRNLHVHHNYLELTDGGSNPNTVAGGITRFGSSFNPYAASANNVWEDNVYATPSQYGFQWELNRELSWSEWQARGQY